MTKTINRNWIMEKDEVIDDDLIVKGSISGKDGQRFNLRVNGDINARNINVRNINARDINARNINARDINARDINARDITAGNIDAWDINAWNLSFWAIAIAYNSFKCKTWKAKRDNFVIKCLGGEVRGKQVK